MGDVVGRRGHEYGTALLREPGQEAPEDAAGTHVFSGRREAFLDLVDPEHGRGNRLRHRRRFADGCLRAAIEGTEGRGQIQTQQRELPLARDCLGAERFATSLHAQEQQAARCGQAEAARLFAKGPPPLAQPALQLAHATHFGQARLDIVELESLSAAQRLSLLAHDPGDGCLVQASGQGAGLAEDAFGLDGRQAERRDHRRAEHALIATLAKLSEERLELGGARQRELDSRNLALELQLQVDHRADQDHALEPLGKERQQVTQAPHGDGLAEDAVGVEHHEDRRLGIGRHHAQALVERAGAFARPQAGGQRPGNQLAPARLSDLLERGEGAFLFEALERDQLPARLDQQLELSHDLGGGSTHSASAVIRATSS